MDKKELQGMKKEEIQNMEHEVISHLNEGLKPIGFLLSSENEDSENKVTRDQLDFYAELDELGGERTCPMGVVKMKVKASVMVVCVECGKSHKVDFDVDSEKLWGMKRMSFNDARRSTLDEDLFNQALMDAGWKQAQNELVCSDKCKAVWILRSFGVVGIANTLSNTDVDSLQRAVDKTAATVDDKREWIGCKECSAHVLLGIHRCPRCNTPVEEEAEAEVVL